MIFIVGHRGYIGSNLFKFLAERGLEVQGIGRSDSLPEFTPVDTIINCACHGWSPEQRGDVWQTVDSNLLLPLDIQAKRNGAKFVHLSASFEFHNPKTPYSRTKKIASGLLKDKATVIYIYTVFGGINEPGWRFMGSLLRACAEGTPYTITTPHATRDFTHIDRVCDGIYKLMPVSPASGAVFHFGHGIARSMERVLGTLEGIAGRRFPNIKVMDSDEGITNWRAETPAFDDTFVDDLAREWRKVSGCRNT